MIIDKYTKHSIFSLPILFNNKITAQELKDNRFINMYVYDENRPLMDCIFLVFKGLSKEFLYKLSKIKGYCNYITQIIDDVDYDIISFTKDEFDNYIVDSINKGLYYTIGFDNKMKIIKFWFNPKMNEKIFKYLFDEHCEVEKPVEEELKITGKNKAVDLISTAFSFISTSD